MRLQLCEHLVLNGLPCSILFYELKRYPALDAVSMGTIAYEIMYIIKLYYFICSLRLMNNVESRL